MSLVISSEGEYNIIAKQAKNHTTVHRNVANVLFHHYDKPKPNLTIKWYLKLISLSACIWMRWLQPLPLLLGIAEKRNNLLVFTVIDMIDQVLLSESYPKIFVGRQIVTHLIVTLLWLLNFKNFGLRLLKVKKSGGQDPLMCENDLKKH